MSNKTIIATMRSDGTLVDSDGHILDAAPPRAMTAEEIETAALADPDAVPMTNEQRHTARRVPRVKALRRALGITQEEFSARFHIPLGTLRDWEQGRAEPDQPTRAYLMVIARAPEAVQHALQTS